MVYRRGNAQDIENSAQTFPNGLHFASSRQIEWLRLDDEVTTGTLYCNVSKMIIGVHGHTMDLAYRSGHRLNAPMGGNTDIPLMRLGGVTAQMCANWTPDILPSGPHTDSMEAPLSSQLSVLAYLHRELAGPAGEDVPLARTSADLRTAADIGRVALIVGMEGTDALCGDPAVLRKLFELGLRHVCLAHEHAIEFGAASQVWEKGKMRRYDPSRDPEGHLTDAGRALIAEMKRLGILIDVMHLVEPAFWEVLDTIAGPVIVSHGGARGMTGSIRYLSNEQILAVARAGGVVGASPTPLGPSLERPGLPLLLDTVDDLFRLVGTSHVGIGTDFKEQPGYYPPGFANSIETPLLIR